MPENIGNNNSDYSKYYSKIKDIYIELPDYEFFHSPSAVDKVDKRFLGRKEIQNKLKNILEVTKVKSGAYLITGYRGVGKTSLVNKVLSELTIWFKIGSIPINKWKAPVTIRLNLGHEELKEKDVLKLISKSVYENYLQWYSKMYWPLIWKTISFGISLAIANFIINILNLGKTEIIKSLDNFFRKYFSIILNKDNPSTEIQGYIKIDYVLCLITIFLTYHVLFYFRTRYFPNLIPSNALAIRKLKFLNQRIDANITKESVKGIDRSWEGFKFGIKAKSIRSFPIAEAKDIEIELINIFKYIDRIWLGKPRFIFVFDELDKIEAHQNKSIEKKEEVEFNATGYSTNAEITRKRQQATSRILANLKHFFTTARAKFIFIAGREMYDATLADISDRNYFLGSIFHDVIYVNSFLTEDPEPINKERTEQDRKNHQSYYHSMIEEFVCQFLMPDKFKYIEKVNDQEQEKDHASRQEQIQESEKITADLTHPKTENEENQKLKNLSTSLKTYKLYLESSISETKQFQLSDNEINMVIFTLNQFITYLTHRSSGSPKKLTHLLENYIYHSEIDTDNKPKIKSDEIETKKINNAIIVKAKGLEKKSKSNYYLRFDYYAQYTFGFISYITVPYYYNISRHVKLYNDKLMVSTTYLIDHLYKFHDFGFSWRNLEVTPEIIDVNKAPTLRRLIEDIVGFLAQTHLQYVVSGLFDFKFKRKLAYEINVLSKISERESAALNFTLDESQEVKSHFRKKLEHINKDSKNDSNSFIHSVGYIQQRLADLHYYDQEYDDASVIYKDSIQKIMKHQSESGSLSPRLLVVLSRMVLKLGLTFERKKSYNSALMIYSELSNLILKSAEIDLSAISLKKKKDLVTGAVKIFDTSNEPKIIGEEFKYNYFKNIRSLPFNSKNYALFYNSSSLETVRLLYQAFVAKLHTTDKEKISGITDDDIQLCIKEIFFLTKVVNEEIERKILTEYLNKIADLLFFKNYQSTIYPAQTLYEKALLTYCSEGLKDTKIFELVIKKINNPKETLDSLKIFKLVIKKINNTEETFEELKILASSLSDYGDAILRNYSSTIKNVNSDVLFHKIAELSELFENSDNSLESFECKHLKDDSLMFYFVSYKIYMINDDYSKAAFQGIKILNTLEALSPTLKHIKNKIDKVISLFKLVTKKTIIALYRSYNSSTRPEVDRFRSILKETDENTDKFHYIINNLPSIAEFKEVRMLYTLNKLRFANEFRCSLEIVCPSFEKTLESYSPGKYANLNSMYSRLHDLYLKVRMNYEILKINIVETSPKEPEKLKSFLEIEKNKQDEEVKNLLLYLIADSIYCLTETIRILKNFGYTYITNHSSFGHAYYRRAEWCLYMEYYKKAYRNENELYLKVRELIGSQAMPNLAVKYNYEKALSHYIQCVETHNNKYTNDRYLEKLYYLEDDFNDVHLHFFTALERLKVESGKIEDKIIFCKEQLQDSKIYDIENYFERSI
jgi:hypothetical protein